MENNNEKSTLKYYSGTFENGDRLQSDAIPIVLYKKIYFEYVGDTPLSYNKALLDANGEFLGDIKIDTFRPKIKTKFGFTILSGEIELIGGYELDSFPEYPKTEVLKKIDDYDKFLKEFELLNWKPVLVQKVLTDGIKDYIRGAKKEKTTRASVIKMVNDFHDKQTQID